MKEENIKSEYQRKVDNADLIAVMAMRSMIASARAPI